jgi:DNA polymerase-1
LPLQVDAVTKRIHTDYMQTVATTEFDKSEFAKYPYSYRTGTKKRRKHLLRDENYTIISADYSQIELRIIAALSGEK